MLVWTDPFSLMELLMGSVCCYLMKSLGSAQSAQKNLGSAQFAQKNLGSAQSAQLETPPNLCYQHIPLLWSLHSRMQAHSHS